LKPETLIDLSEYILSTKSLNLSHTAITGLADHHYVTSANGY